MPPSCPDGLSGGLDAGQDEEDVEGRRRSHQADDDQRDRIESIGHRHAGGGGQDPEYEDAHTSEEAEKWNNATSARLKAANVTLIPTLTLFSGDDKFNSILKEVKSYSDIRGQIMFGTDIGYLTDYPSLTREYGYLARAGLTFPQILASLTTTPAARLGYAKLTGQVKPGMDADLTLLEGDPARDIDAFAHVALTMRKGQIIYSKP